ncbi:MAG: alpha/beta fold hydrolase [Flavobacteriales bacterium]|nr:MAG: alpha/beta fold hydrolase [Flavobacteriales bacterium]
MNDLPFFHIHKKSNLENLPSPLLLMVHGYGSNEQDLFSFSRAIPEKFTIVSIRGDIEIQYNGFAWYNITIDFNGKKSYDINKAIESRDNIIKVIEICKKIYNIDPNNVNLMGFSQGSMLVNAVALTYPEQIRNVISLSGAFDKNIINISKISSFEGLSFYISHGLNDEILPFNLSKQSIEILSENNIDHVFEEYPIGHGVSPENFKSMLSWLIKKTN